MEGNPFQNRVPYIMENPKIRTPQKKVYEALSDFAKDQIQQEREVGIVLPVGCGKSGCITLTPFAFKATRTLVVAPGLNIAKQLHDDFDPSKPNMFYIKYDVLNGEPYPEPVEIRGTTTNLEDLKEADVVLTNIQQLQRENNRWLNSFPGDFFDLILFDEGHHSVAESWDTLKQKFQSAKIVNFSATPCRADGQLMAGRILYSFPVSQAIKDGYVKQLTAVVLSPRTLSYIRREDGKEIEVKLDEVRRLGEEDADFRRSIVTSTETLNTIVDASIRELDKLRDNTEESRLKIIASALNYEHCHQIVEAYRARGLNADFVHSREESSANQKVMQKLENHELDVIVQVRKLGEGFDHPYLVVAAIFNLFANLSPFIQFVGRIMRVIEQNSPGHPLNQGRVVFHAGANIAKRWQDFQEYSEADQEFFDCFLPMEEVLDFTESSEIEIDPQSQNLNDNQGYEVQTQSIVQLEEIPLIKDDTEALDALNTLKQKGYTTEQITQAFKDLEPVPVTKVRQRQAKRAGLDERVQTETGRILSENGLNSHGRDLDKRHVNINFVVIKSAIDRGINAFVGKKSGKRHEFTREELEKIDANFTDILDKAIQEVFDAKD